MSNENIEVKGGFKTKEGTVLVSDFGAMLIPSKGFREGFRFGLLIQGVVENFKGKTRDKVMMFLIEWMEKAGFSSKTVDSCFGTYEKFLSEKLKA